jgi:micrococcal nuclease
MLKDNYVRAAKVVNVVDGDTVDVIIDLGFNVSIKHRMRVRRINTPEKVGATKEAGLIAKAFATERLLNKDIVIQSYNREDKAFKVDSTGGRWLAEVYFIDQTGRQVNYSDCALGANMAILFMDKY